MKKEELFVLAEKAGLGFVRHASEKDIEKFDQLAQLIVQNTLEEMAQKFDKMPFGDTSASFAIFVRNMKTGDPSDQQNTV